MGVGVRGVDAALEICSRRTFHRHLNPRLQLKRDVRLARPDGARTKKRFETISVNESNRLTKIMTEVTSVPCQIRTARFTDFMIQRNWDLLPK